jgi:hypothetical protein
MTTTTNTEFTLVVIRNKQNKVLDIIFPDFHNRSLYNAPTDSVQLEEMGLEEFCIQKATYVLTNARAEKIVSPFQSTPAGMIDHRRILQVAQASPPLPSSSRSAPPSTLQSLIPTKVEKLSISLPYNRPVGGIEKTAHGFIWSMQLISTLLMGLSTFLSVKLIFKSDKIATEIGTPSPILTAQIAMRLIMFVTTDAAVAIRYPAKTLEDKIYGRKNHHHHTTASRTRILPFFLANLMGIGATIAQELFNFQSMRSLGNGLDAIDQRPNWLSNEILFGAALIYAITDGITNAILNLNMTQGFAQKWADRSCPRRHPPVQRLADLPSPATHRGHAHTRTVSEMGAIADAIAAETPCDSDEDRSDRAKLLRDGNGTTTSAQQSAHTAVAGMSSPIRQRRTGTTPQNAHVIPITSPKPSDSLLSPGSKMRAAQLTPS